MSDRDEPLITDEMIGHMVVFGADVILFAGLLWVVDVLSAAAAAGVSIAVVAAFAGWVLYRWVSLRPEPDGAGDPVETLKRRYAAGELSEAEFEEKLERLLDADERRDGRAEPATERE